MRRNGDRNFRGGDRRLPDRGYGVNRSGDPVSCVCPLNDTNYRITTDIEFRVTTDGDMRKVT